MAKMKVKYDRLSYLASRDELSIKEVKAEYNRFKRAAKDRLSRLGEFKETERYRYYSEFFKEGVRGKKERELRQMLNEAYNFITNPANTLRGMREHRKSVIESLNERAGEDFLNTENVNQFYSFMNDKQAKAILRGLDSDQKVSLAKMRLKGLSMKTILKDFDALLDNEDAVNEYLDTHSDRKRALSSYDLRSILE